MRKSDSDAMPILITSAVSVAASFTQLTDTDVRFKLTLDAIHQWMKTPGVQSIVVCDGSGFDFSPHVDFGINKEIEFEFLYFRNDAEMVALKGKGYGEGQIVEYALLHSKILKQSSFFAKCSGKLWVTNFESCKNKFNGTAAFDFNGKLNPRFIDTRFYIVEKNFYQSKLATAYLTVNDGAKYYLEHAFKTALSHMRISQYAMYPTPRVSGVSGSMAKRYMPSVLKPMLRDLRSLFIKWVAL